jgi:hypothetical protein
MPKVERTLGWLFVVVVIAAVGGAIYAATQPMEDVTSHLHLQNHLDMQKMH